MTEVRIFITTPVCNHNLWYLTGFLCCILDQIYSTRVTPPPPRYQTHWSHLTVVRCSPSRPPGSMSCYPVHRSRHVEARQSHGVLEHCEPHVFVGHEQGVARIVASLGQIPLARHNEPGVGANDRAILSRRYTPAAYPPWNRGRWGVGDCRALHFPVYCPLSYVLQVAQCICLDALNVARRFCAVQR
jgi:hypothetical protein